MSVKSIDIDALLPLRVRQVDLYDPLREPIEYDLSDNTSQWGMAPLVLEKIRALVQNDINGLSKYPDIYANSLKEAIAKKYSQYLGGSSAKIIVGNGTDDVLDCIVRALTDEGDIILNPMPSFPMAGYFAKFNGRKVQVVELNKDGSLNVESILSTQAKLIYLCSPNNPTGLSISKDQIIEILEKCTSFVVVDEAYAEFSNQNCLGLLEKYSNLIVMRTFSKLHALAGLRIGFGLGNEKVISAVEALRGPYKANTIAITAASCSLEQNTFQSEVLEQTKMVRDWFISELKELGFSPIESDANFVFVPFESIENIKDVFAQSGISVRIFEDLAVYGSGIRITIAPKETLIKVLNILDLLVKDSKDDK